MYKNNWTLEDEEEEQDINGNKTPQRHLLGLARSLVLKDDESYQTLREKYTGNTDFAFKLTPSSKILQSMAADSREESFTEKTDEDDEEEDEFIASPGIMQPVYIKEGNPVFNHQHKQHKALNASSSIEAAIIEEEELMKEVDVKSDLSVRFSEKRPGAEIFNEIPSNASPTVMARSNVDAEKEHKSKDRNATRRLSSLPQQISEHKLDFLKSPGPTNEMLRCYIMRKKGIFGGYPSYELYLDQGDTFLLSARKRKKSKSSYYLLSTEKEFTKRDSEGSFAKLRANYLGSEYTLFATGTDSDNTEKDELLLVRFKQTVLTVKGGPRKMTACFTHPDHQSSPGAFTNLTERYMQAKKGGKSNDSPELTVLRTKEPIWNDRIKGYVLDFKGRVKLPSVKNFLMEECSIVKGSEEMESNAKSLSVLFGKNGPNLYALDVAYPCSILQAFGMALCMMDAKLVNTL